tara:strand:+ start:3913 stop:4143 length:231 start_codon:yes stop_codon:yes gene_type:complete
MQTFKELMIEISKDQVKIAQANKRVEKKFHESLVDDDGIEIFDDDRHDSDADDLKRESAELRKETSESIRRIINDR